MISNEEARDQQIVRLLMETDLTGDEIAEKVGCGKTLVGKWRKELRESTDGVKAVQKLSPSLVLAMAEQVKDDGMRRELQHLANGLDSYEKLDIQMNQALGTAITKLHEKILNEDIKFSEFMRCIEMINKTKATISIRPAVEVNISQSNTQVVQNAVTERLDGLLKGVFDAPVIEGEVE